MASSGPGFSREGRLLWAGLGVFFATLVAIGLAAQVPNLEACQQCGVSLSGTPCDPGSPGGCGSLLASVAGLVVGLTGLCVLIAVNASVAFRAKRGALVLSFLAPGGSSAGVFLQISSVTMMAEGAQFLGIGVVVPFFQSCHEGCPVPYALSGLAWLFVGVGALLVLVGTLGFIGTRRSGLRRTDPSRPLSTP